MGGGLLRWAAVVAAGVVTMAGCGSAARSNALVYRGSAFAVLAPVNEANTVSFGAIQLCTVGGDVSVTEIKAAETHGGLIVAGWGYRPDPISQGGYGLGAEPKPLSSLGFMSGPATVASGCGSAKTPGLEFAVQLQRPARGHAAWTVGLDVGYSTSDGISNHLRLPLTFGFCGEPPSGVAAPDECAPSTVTN